MSRHCSYPASKKPAYLVEHLLVCHQNAHNARYVEPQVLYETTYDLQLDKSKARRSCHPSQIPMTLDTAERVSFQERSKAASQSLSSGNGLCQIDLLAHLSAVRVLCMGRMVRKLPEPSE